MAVCLLVYVQFVDYSVRFVDKAPQHGEVTIENKKKQPKNKLKVSLGKMRNLLKSRDSRRKVRVEKHQLDSVLSAFYSGNQSSDRKLFSRNLIGSPQQRERVHESLIMMTTLIHFPLFEILHVLYASKDIIFLSKGQRFGALWRGKSMHYFTQGWRLQQVPVVM